MGFCILESGTMFSNKQQIMFLFHLKRSCVELPPGSTTTVCKDFPWNWVSNTSITFQAYSKRPPKALQSKWLLASKSFSEELWWLLGEVFWGGIYFLQFQKFQCNFLHVSSSTELLQSMEGQNRHSSGVISLTCFRCLLWDGIEFHPRSTFLCSKVNIKGPDQTWSCTL